MARQTARLCALWLSASLALGCSDDPSDTPAPDSDAASDGGLDATPDAGDAEDGPDQTGQDVTGDASDVVADGPPDAPPGPPAILLTINELPASMNGSLPYSDDGGPLTDFRLVLPTFGFTLDVLPDRPTAFLDPETLDVRCDQGFGVAGERPAEDNLADLFDWRPDRLRWLVPDDLALGEGTVRCEAQVSGLDGQDASPSSITFDTLTMTPELHPFDPPDSWVVTFSRDRYDIELIVDGPGVYSVEADEVEGGDGEPDFTEDLRLLGLQGDESGVGAASLSARGVVGANAIVREWVIDDTMRQLRELYGLDPASGTFVDEDAVRLTIWREGDDGAPIDVAFDDTYSIHGVGGDSPPGVTVNFGRASAIDVNNPTAQDDSRLGYGSFTTSLSRVVITQPAGQFLLAEFLPGRGEPIGQLDIDALVLADDFDRTGASRAERVRYDELIFALELYTKALSALIAHEIGHSLGLIACGAPPGGLFGGIWDPSFMASDAGCAHIDTPGLNVMQTGASLLDNPGSIADGVTFNPLALAYLRGRIIVIE